MERKEEKTEEGEEKKEREARSGFSKNLPSFVTSFFPTPAYGHAYGAIGSTVPLEGVVSPSETESIDSSRTTPNVVTPFRRTPSFRSSSPKTPRESLLPELLLEHQPPPPYFIVSLPLQTSRGISQHTIYLVKVLFWTAIVLLLFLSFFRILHLKVSSQT